MSKTSATSQSMAALFTPESAKLRASQKDQASNTQGPGGGFRVPGAKASAQTGKSGDTLGNPNSPGYENMRVKKKQGSGEAQGETPAEAAQTPGYTVPEEGSRYIRLGSGWEKLLLAQKKVCEKAKGLFTLLEGPSTYTSQRKKGKLPKTRGCIIDLDVEELAPARDDPKKDVA